MLSLVYHYLYIHWGSLKRFHLVLVGITSRSVADLFACFRLEIICKADDIQNGTKNATPRGREGEKVQYTCDPGYVLDGTPVLTCTSSAAWDKPKPKCQDGACEYSKENCSPSYKQIYSRNEERAYRTIIWLLFISIVLLPWWWIIHWLWFSHFVQEFCPPLLIIGRLVKPSSISTLTISQIWMQSLSLICCCNESNSTRHSRTTLYPIWRRCACDVIRSFDLIVSRAQNVQNGLLPSFFRFWSRTDFPCGEVSVAGRHRIVGGHEALRGTWPWMVRIAKFDGKGKDEEFPSWASVYRFHKPHKSNYQGN